MSQEWEEISKEIVTKELRKILILGGNDVGKSTLVGYLANFLVKSGYSVGIVDGDVGQSHIGPPATISLGEPLEPFFSLNRIKPRAMYFVGSTTPKGHLLQMLTGTKLMVEKALNNKFVVINTTGLIDSAGVALKTSKIELLEPDIIIAIQRGKELEKILEPFSFFNIRRLNVPEKTRRKGIRERKKLREKAFREYFRRSKRLKLRFEEIKFCRFSKFEKNLLLGLADEKNSILGLGILIDWNGELEIETPVKEKVRIVHFGYVKISKYGREF
jgi:polynucleotide 5'-hydroxyl-kinase GRC3/NOL9